jgi:cytochrome P450
MSSNRILDIERVRELFELEGSYLETSGGAYRGDPNPKWHELRASGPVHPGTVHDLSELGRPATFHGLPEEGREHFSAFSFEACDFVYRNPDTFASSPIEPDVRSGEAGVFNSMLTMNGAEHRRYRALVQPSFMPAKAEWWLRNWIEGTVEDLIDAFIDDGRAELNVDFCAAIPVLTITGSFGFSVEQALDVRASFHDPMKVISMIQPIVAARREEPEDDLISVLVQAEITDEDGTTQRLTDPEIYSFALLLLMAGSGTTWKQMGLILNILLNNPELLERVRSDRSLLKPTIDESVRWVPTDPMFSRWVTTDTELGGVAMPAGAVIHLCLGAANRDPARWVDPDAFDIDRPAKTTLAFGGGPHICLGMHVARAELMTGINALLDRLPGLRLDPGKSAPEIVGFYERGSTALHVEFG